MRIPRGKPKGQSNVEYAIIIALVAIVVLLLIPPIISGVRYAINTVGNSLGAQTPTDVPAVSSSTANFATMIITIFATMGIPSGVSFITSFYDGAIADSSGQLGTRRRRVERDGLGRCINCAAMENYGRLSAKLCLSAISFEVWGITNASQQQVGLHPAIRTDQLIIILIFLILINIGLHYMCSKRIPNKKMELRIFLVFLSMLIPVSIFYNLTL